MIDMISFDTLYNFLPISISQIFILTKYIEICCREKKIIINIRYACIHHNNQTDFFLLQNSIFPFPKGGAAYLILKAIILCNVRSIYARTFHWPCGHWPRIFSRSSVVCVNCMSSQSGDYKDARINTEAWRKPLIMEVLISKFKNFLSLEAKI